MDNSSLNLNEVFGGFAASKSWDQDVIAFSKQDYEDIWPLLEQLLHEYVERAIAAAYVLELITPEGNGVFQDVFEEYHADMLDEDTRRTIDRVNYELVLADLNASAENAFTQLNGGSENEINNVKYALKRLRGAVVLHAAKANVINEDYSLSNIGPKLSFNPKC